MKIRKNANTYTRIRLLSSVRLVVREAQFRTAAIDARPMINDGKETSQRRLCAK
jgi:hypothetical protein